MSNLAPIQQKILDILNAALDENLEGLKPVTVKLYEGELANIRQVRNMPAVFVDAPNTFDMRGQGSGGTIYDGDYNPELILFVQNKASGKEKVHDLARLCDWVINALKTKTVMIDGAPLELGRNVSGRLITDMEPASAILTLNLTNLE